MSVAEALELLGAFLLNACEEDEAQQVLAALASAPMLGPETDPLIEAASLLGLLVSVVPPPRVWSAVSARLVPIALLAETNQLFEDAVTQLGPKDWSRNLVGGWTRHDLSGWSPSELVGHLAAGHQLLSARLRGDATHGELEDVIAVAADFAATAPTVSLLRQWRDSAEELMRAARRPSSDLVGWLGGSVSPSMATMERAFETWIHANDLRRVVGQAEQHPSEGHLHLLCDLAVSLLPTALGIAGFGRPGSIRIVLEGPGGGHWVMPLTAGVESNNFAGTLIMESLDLCALMGDRLHPDNFTCRIEGPSDLIHLAQELAMAAGVFAHR